MSILALILVFPQNFAELRVPAGVTILTLLMIAVLLAIAILFLANLLVISLL